MSNAVNPRNEGTPDAPEGEAKNKFCDWLLSVAVRVPDVVTGLPDTVNIEGMDNPTLVTVPDPPPPVSSTAGAHALPFHFNT
jgi:hypothetical protein